MFYQGHRENCSSRSKVQTKKSLNLKKNNKTCRQKSYILHWKLKKKKSPKLAWNLILITSNGEVTVREIPPDIAPALASIIALLSCPEEGSSSIPQHSPLINPSNHTRKRGGIENSTENTKTKAQATETRCLYPNSKGNQTIRRKRKYHRSDAANMRPKLRRSELKDREINLTPPIFSSKSTEYASTATDFRFSNERLDISVRFIGRGRSWKK